MKTKSLIDSYKEDQEAWGFIQSHLHIFSEASYNDTTHINPHIIKIKDVSLFIDNIALLKSKKSIAIMTDYFKSLPIPAITAKYGLKDDNSTTSQIHYYKNLIIKRLEKLLDLQLSLELKKVSNKELKNKLTDITLNLTKKNIKLFLVKVKHINKVNYKYFDEDVLQLYKKAEYIYQFLSPLEQKRVKKILKKYPDPEDLTISYFDDLKAIVSHYRIVNKDGYFLPKIVDDAVISIILAYEKSEEKHELN